MRLGASCVLQLPHPRVRHEDFVSKLLEALGSIDCVVFPFSGEAPTMTAVAGLDLE